MPNRTCSVEGCESRERCKGLCNKHYLRFRNHGDPLYRFKPEGKQTCTIELCEKFVAGNRLCDMHYMRLKRSGTTADPVKTIKHCKQEGCSRKYYGREFCHMHYRRLYTHGDVNYRSPGEVRNGLRICASCKVDQPIEEYGVDRSVKSGRSIYCKPCIAMKVATWYQDNQDQARATYKAYSKKNPHLILAKVQRRNALKRKQFIEDVDRLVLAERDGWMCGICSGLILQKAWPHPESLSVDHIIPVSRGGLHGYSNTQASHLACNIRKGAKVS